MEKFDYAGLKDVAEGLIDSFGSDTTLTQLGTTVPNSFEPTADLTPIAVTMVALPVSSVASNNAVFQKYVNTQTSKELLYLLVSPKGVSSLKLGDKINIDGLDFPILKLNPINPARTTMVLYEAIVGR